MLLHYVSAGSGAVEVMLYHSYHSIVKWRGLGPTLSNYNFHYSDVIMGTISSQITSLAIVYLTVYSTADQREHQSSASLAVVCGIHRWSVNSPHKWPVTRKRFPFDDVIMKSSDCVHAEWFMYSHGNLIESTLTATSLWWISAKKDVTPLLAAMALRLCCINPSIISPAHNRHVIIICHHSSLFYSGNE